MSGFVRAYRSALGHPAFRNDGEAMAFIWLTMRAAWRPTRVRYKERIIELDRGELIVSVRDMASALERSKSWADRFLKRLESETMIGTASVSGLKRITICKYDDFQSLSNDVGTASGTPGGTGAGQGRDTEQRREEVKEINTPHKPPKGGGGKHLIPADWKPPVPADLPPNAKSCALQWSKASYDAEAEAFHCYWQSERKMKADWRMTWANRVIARHSAIMRDQKFGNAPPEMPGRERRPMTPDELRRAIQFRRDRGDEEGAKRYEAELAQRKAA